MESEKKSRILTPEAAVSVVFRCCCCCSEADGQIHLYKIEKMFHFLFILLKNFNNYVVSCGLSLEHEYL